MRNESFKPNPGAVYKYTNRQGNCIYRMYVKLPNSDTLLCVQLNSGLAYAHIEGNGLTSSEESFAFNMCDLVGKE